MAYIRLDEIFALAKSRYDRVLSGKIKAAYSAAENEFEIETSVTKLTGLKDTAPEKIPGLQTKISFNKSDFITEDGAVKVSEAALPKFMLLLHSGLEMIPENYQTITNIADSSDFTEDSVRRKMDGLRALYNASIRGSEEIEFPDNHIFYLGQWFNINALRYYNVQQERQIAPNFTLAKSEGPHFLAIFHKETDPSQYPYISPDTKNDNCKITISRSLELRPDDANLLNEAIKDAYKKYLLKCRTQPNEIPNQITVKLNLRGYEIELELDPKEMKWIYTEGRDRFVFNARLLEVIGEQLPYGVTLRKNGVHNESLHTIFDVKPISENPSDEAIKVFDDLRNEVIQYALALKPNDKSITTPSGITICKPDFTFEITREGRLKNFLVSEEIADAICTKSCKLLQAQGGGRDGEGVLFRR